MNISILFEDSDLFVVDKPANLVVNRAESVKTETLQDWIEEYLKVTKVPHVPKVSIEVSKKKFATSATFATFDTFFARSGIVHRLDKETSGCLIIAKNPLSFVKLQQAFKEHLVKKTYVALVHGKLVPEEGEIIAPIGRLPWNREKFGVVPGGKKAVTSYKSIKYYKDDKSYNSYTLVELHPKTGRTHQLRVHLKYLGFPIVGDYLYAGRKLQKQDRQWCPRVFLHAAKIEFPHPVNKTEVKVVSPMPVELQKVLDKLINVSVNT